jgi:bacterial/archaeal transporter family-2 protein
MKKNIIIQIDCIGGVTMGTLLFFFLMFLGGMAVAVQPSINGRLAQRVGVLESSCISFTVGTIALLILVLVAGRGSLRAVGDVRWWELSGGLLGAFFVTLTIVVVPRIGTAASMAAIIASQLITGLILDHYGLFGFRSVPFDARRSVGTFLLLAGAALVFRR